MSRGKEAVRPRGEQALADAPLVSLAAGPTRLLQAIARVCPDKEVSTMRSFVYMLVLSCVTAATPPAAANLYWIAYEGNDFPENEGWVRNFGDENGPLQGGAVRTITDGVLELDGLRHDQIFDFYMMDRPLDPDPGELFLVQWRLHVVETPGLPDVSVAIFSDEDRGLGFNIGETHLESVFEGDGFHPRPQASFTAGVFHEFQVRSADMLTYELYIDGSLGLQGEFWDPLATASSVRWGDGVQGRKSLSRWDHFRFGVVPEPLSVLLFISCLLLVARR
jgi:hypothetical protein